MDYDGIENIVCDAEENDWLEISYAERKYVKENPKNKRARGQRRQRRTTAPNTKKGIWKYAVVVVLCVAILAGMLFLDGDFKQEVFAAVKSATASIFHRNDSVAENKINIPCNLTLLDVNDGVMTFNGGRAALSLTAGKVSQVDQDSVVVAIDEETSIVYSGLTDIYVSVADEVAANALLGKYDGQFTASILQKGEIVKQVVGSESQLIWNI